MVPFQAGQTKPEGSGRKKGTPNNKTLILNEIMENLGLDVPTRLCELLPLLKPSKQADVLLQLMGYLYPRRKSVECFIERGFNEEEKPELTHEEKAREIISMYKIFSEIEEEPEVRNAYKVLAERDEKLLINNASLFKDNSTIDHT